MFVTIVEGIVEAVREGDLRSAWEVKSAGALPAGFIESSLMRAEDGGADATVTSREPVPSAAIPGMAIPGMGGSAVSDTEADEMEEHLRGLGYIE